MQRIWAVVLSVWAMLAIVAFLAWSRPPAAPVPQAAAQTLVVKTVNGKQQLVVAQPAVLGAAHATTATSAVPKP